jgi:hypothetical protein
MWALSEGAPLSRYQTNITLFGFVIFAIGVIGTPTQFSQARLSFLRGSKRTIDMKTG